MLNKGLTIVFLGLSFFVVFDCACLAVSEEEAPKEYILISVQELSRTNNFWLSRLSRMVPELKPVYLEYGSAQAQGYLEQFQITFLPFVILPPVATPSGEYADIQFQNSLIRENNSFVLRPEVLFTNQVMLLNRESRPQELSIFVHQASWAAEKDIAKLINFIRKNKLGINLQFRYLVDIERTDASGLDWPDERLEDLRQIVIQEYYPEKFLDYLLLLQEKEPAQALEELGLSLADIQAQKVQARQLAKDNLQLARELGIRSLPAFFWENKYLITRLDELREHPPFNKQAAEIVPAEVVLGPVNIEFFYSPHCRSCARIKSELLPQLKSKYQEKIEIHYHDVTKTEELELKFALEQKYGIFGGMVPQVYLPQAAFEASWAIRNNLDRAIEQAVSRKDIPAHRRMSLSANPILDKFASFSPALVSLAGLIDGINPCAFATIVFFVSLLSVNRYRKKQIAYISGAFILAVFLTYLALGLGILEVLNKLQNFTFFVNLVYYAIAYLALGLGLFSLADYIYYQRTGSGLTQKACDLRMYNRLRQIVDSNKGLASLIVLALVNGFIIAVLESACTGQVYFPTIAFVLKTPALRVDAIFYLILYNLTFILPLVIIFILTYQGVNSERVTAFANRHTAGIKLATSGLFFILAAALFVF